MQQDQHYNIIRYHGSMRISYLTFVMVLLGFFAQINYFIQNTLQVQVEVSSMIFSLFTILLLVYYHAYHQKRETYHYTFVYLLSTFTLLVTWRISAMTGMKTAVLLFFAAFILKVINYILCAYNDYQTAQSDNRDALLGIPYHWQLFFIRMLIGFVLVPHFTEKLFAGTYHRMNDVQSFMHMGLHAPLLFVYMAGMVELVACISIGCGLFTRLGAILLTGYLLVASYLGGHFAIGFIWASPGGGWEYPVVWALLAATFIFFGADRFSLDFIIRSQWQGCPKWLKLFVR